LTTYLSAKTSLGERGLRAAVATFQTLCKFGDFTTMSGQTGAGTDVSHAGNDDSTGDNPRDELRPPQAKDKNGSVTINVNIALSVDATSDPAVYDAFFAAMAKHIKVLDGGSSQAS